MPNFLDLNGNSLITLSADLVLSKDPEFCLWLQVRSYDYTPEGNIPACYSWGVYNQAYVLDFLSSHYDSLLESSFILIEDIKALVNKSTNIRRGGFSQCVGSGITEYEKNVPDLLDLLFNSWEYVDE